MFRALAAISIDGKIAKSTNHFSDWTSPEDKAYLHQMLDATDVIVIGRTTYELAAKPLAKRNCLVLTRRVTTSETVTPRLTYVNPAGTNLRTLIQERGYQTVCVLGGAETYSWCLKEKLIDELHLTIEPVTFGTGIALFTEPLETAWELAETRRLNEHGSLLLIYRRPTALK